MSETIELSFSG